MRERWSIAERTGIRRTCSTVRAEARGRHRDATRRDCQRQSRGTQTPLTLCNTTRNSMGGQVKIYLAPSNISRVGGTRAGGSPPEGPKTEGAPVLIRVSFLSMLAKTRSDCTVRDTMRDVAKRETRIRLLRYSFGPDRAIADRRTQIVKRKSLSPILHQLMAWSIATLPVSRGQ